jgi:hypothetical protein
MLLEAEINKCCPSGYVFGAISNLITWVPKFFLSVLYWLGVGMCSYDASTVSSFDVSLLSP